jgi:hypothetical protein
MKFIEDKQVAYVMSCKLTARLQSTIYGLKNRKAIGIGIWITEIEFKQGNWSKSRRIVFIYLF